MEKKPKSFLLGFKAQFATDILLGNKIHTIRECAVRQPEVGRTIKMYSGLRTKNCKLITDVHKIVSVQRVDIKIEKFKDSYKANICIDGRVLCCLEKQMLAIKDGFANSGRLYDFFLDGRQSVDLKDYKLIHWTSARY